MNDARARHLLPALARWALGMMTTSLLLACSSTSTPVSTSATGGLGGSASSSSAASGMGGSPGVSSPSVCGFKGAVSLGEPAADGFVDVPPNHPDILYFGRVDCSNPKAPAFAFPGVSIRMRFQGDSLDLRLTDHGTGGATGTNYYDVILDGKAPVVLQVSPAQEVYPIGRQLGPGEHTVEVFKRIESAPGGQANAGKGELLGFRILKGSTILPLAARPHRIELIGDSITCGYGNEVSTTTPDSSHYTTHESNADLAWGAVAARALDAEYMAVAYSGRGVSKNFMGGAGDTLPQMYGKSLPDDPAAAPWSVAAWTPEVVVINLGTNDFSAAGTDEAAYRDAYLAFLKTLRGYYPTATFLLAAGPMISDYYPVGEMAWTKIQADLQQIIAERKDAGDAAIASLIFQPQSAPYGEDYHPTVATHQAMANQLVAQIKQLQGW
jgi:lysophospholipase L1-like esterase